jgi:16S rRNA (cytosine967-C5)-methyltransferase
VSKGALGPRRQTGRPKSAETPSINVSPARAAAFTILERVGNSSAHSDDLLHGPAMSELSQQDKNLAHALVLGVLRWQIALDARIIPLLSRPDLQVSHLIATAIRLGAFQLLYMDRIPAHAALSESVELTRRAGQAHATGMVNAILRKVAAELAAPKEPAKPKLYEHVSALAERLGHPDWIVERWVKNFGRATAIAICEYDQKEPEAGELFANSPLSAEGVPKLDDGSRLVAELAAAAVPAATRIWDCCAAPGGKTQILAARHPSAEILASDISPKRLASMAARLEREVPRGRIRLLTADAAKLPLEEGDFDLILCDVPCSGTGTLCRNPEIRHHLKPSDLPRQVLRQQEILRAALGRLAPGGRLVYSTCSLEPEECEGVVAEVMRSVTGLVKVPVEQLLDQLGLSQSLVKDGCLRTLPGVGFQGDGFFAAVLERAGQSG